MVNAREDRPLTRLEVLLLARLSVAKAPSAPELARTVHELALPEESPARAREVALETLEALRDRGLVKRPPHRRKGTLGERSLTEDGRRALCAVFGLARAPRWSEVRDAHLPAVALGQQPGSEQAKAMIGSAEAIAAAVLRGKLEIEHAPTVSALCDALIAEALGMPPGKLTLGKIRAHVLARRCEVEARGEPSDIAARVAAVELKIRGCANKDAFDRALGRRWVREGAEAWAPGCSPEPPSPAPAPPGPPAPEPPPAPADVSAALLQRVREAIPRVGEEGRFGDEKVFVSALWHRMERDRRLGDLSLDRFKRWLVRANRDGWLVLVRADLVGAMDATLVADSEIEDRGATFHFVIDPRWVAAASERRTHVR